MVFLGTAGTKQTHQSTARLGRTWGAHKGRFYFYRQYDNKNDAGIAGVTALIVDEIC